MKTIPVEVVSRVDGKKVAAQQVLCSKCGCDSFIIYAIGQHTHLQCTQCTECFCNRECENEVPQ